MHEASQSGPCCFLTMTYSEEACPVGLRYRDFQLFMKRLRRARGGAPVRFYMCGEYGEATARPHYHAALFGEDFSADRYAWRDFGSGQVAYRSELLERLWPYGASSIGELTRLSAAYIARYVMKKVTGPLAKEYYKAVDLSTGEVRPVSPEFTRMSLKPGIGASWFERYHSDVFPHDRVVTRGQPAKPPRYYDQLLERRDPFMFQAVKWRREEEAYETLPDQAPHRLRAREICTDARLAMFHRSKV